MLAIQELAYAGHLNYWSVADAYLSGQPDMMACLDGHLYALELKAKDTVLEPIQKFVLRRYARAGATAGVIRADESAVLGFRFYPIDPAGTLCQSFEPASTNWLAEIRVERHQ